MKIKNNTRLEATRKLNQYLQLNGCDRPSQYTIRVRIDLYCKLKKIARPSNSKINKFLSDQYGVSERVSSKSTSVKKRTKKEWNRVRLDKRQEYDKYIASSKWKAFRDKIIQKRGKSCEKCGAKNTTIHAHHITYARFMNEIEEDILLVCVPCHENIHGRRIGVKSKS